MCYSLPFIQIVIFTLIVLFDCATIVEAFSQSHVLISHQINSENQYNLRDDRQRFCCQYHPDPVNSSRISRGNNGLNMVWFFGGSEDTSKDAESCELVAVKIDKTSANSRRIGGEIIVDAPLDDVWAILTDYDNLSTHIPNLVESRRIGTKGNLLGSEPGDGNHKCQLYQKGAQKIIGFDFRASVTMDMVEKVLVSGNTVNSALDPKTLPMFMPEKRIGFKCIDSMFFSEFDGEWQVQEGESSVTGEPQCTVSYIVDVRPKGPVPVAALEWRIREDVPTNLRAVKKSAQEVGLRGVMASRSALEMKRTSNDRVNDFVGRFKDPRTMEYTEAEEVWSEDETMAMYLQDDYM